jgi:hypothetical protein
MSSFSKSSRIQLFATGALAGVLSWLPCAYATDPDQNGELGIVADQIRSQGYICENPSSVTRSAAESTPDEPVYVLQCDGTRYHVRLIPDQAAEVSEIAIGR